jgi:plasmid stabilization system protein ParE
MKVRYTPRARGDMDAILSYIDQRNPQGARNVARTMHKTIELIGQFPQAGRLAGEQGTRVLPVDRYLYLISLLERRRWRGLDRTYQTRRPPAVGP